jgi:hypothetical protein
MLEEKQVRYLQYLAMQAGRSIEIYEEFIMLDKWQYPLEANESGYRNTVFNLQFDIEFARKYGNSANA